MSLADDAPAIEVEGLTKFFGAKKVVDGLSLRVMRGEIFGFLGPNGSGKTTTIRMLCGLLTPTARQGLLSWLRYPDAARGDQAARRLYDTALFAL